VDDGGGAVQKVASFPPLQRSLGDRLVWQNQPELHQLKYASPLSQGLTTRIMIFYDKSPHNEDKYRHIL
jgi:hypothetical protein